MFSERFSICCIVFFLIAGLDHSFMFSRLSVKVHFFIDQTTINCIYGTLAMSSPANFKVTRRVPAMSL